jgi:hypothetical protein
MEGMMETTIENLNFKTVDLLSATSDFILSLKKVAVPNWSAQRLFNDLANYDSTRSYYSFMQLRMAKTNDKPIAWSLVFQWKTSSNKEIWLYTDPQYRKLGLQKKYLIQYWKNRFGCDVTKKFNYQTIFNNQTQAFKYLLGKKERKMKEKEAKIRQKQLTFSY